jgi:dihydropteroate synthase
MRFNPRFVNVRDIDEAQTHIESLGSDDQGKAIMAPKMVHRVVHVDNVDTRAANILKQEMLSIGGEASLPREVFDFEGKEVSAILSGSLKHYKLLTRKLKRQPFGLKALSQELEALF